MEPAMRRDTTRNTTREYRLGYQSVANNVVDMSRQTPASHLTHAELAPSVELAADCHVVGHNLRLPSPARARVAAAPSLRFEDYPSEVGKREIAISDAAARLANALHLHLD